MFASCLMRLKPVLHHSVLRACLQGNSASMPSLPKDKAMGASRHFEVLSLWPHYYDTHHITANLHTPMCKVAACPPPVSLSFRAAAARGKCFLSCAGGRPNIGSLETVQAMQHFTGLSLSLRPSALPELGQGCGAVWTKATSALS